MASTPFALRRQARGAGSARRFICPLAISVGLHAPASSMRSTTYPKTIRTQVVSHRFDLKSSCLSSPWEIQSASYDAESDSHPIHRSELLDFAERIEPLLERA